MTAEADWQIRAIVENWLTEVRAHDGAGIAALDTPDASFMLPNAEDWVGRDVIVAAWTPLFALPQPIPDVRSCPHRCGGGGRYGRGEGSPTRTSDD